MRDEAAVAARASAVGEVLAGRVDELTDDIQAVIVELIPDLRDAGTDVLREFVRASMKNAVHALETREDAAEATAPASALEYAQALAQVDVAPTALIRAYRVGQTRFLRRCIEDLLTTSSAPVDVLATLHIVESVSDRVDQVVEQVLAAYEQSRELKLRDRSAVLAGRVRELLRGDQGDVDGTEVALGYRLRQSHVASIVSVDDGAFDALVRTRRFFERLKREGTPYVNLDRIVDSLLLGPSHHSLGLQVADLVVACTRAAQNAPPGDATRWYKQLLPRFARHPDTGELDGVGLVTFPGRVKPEQAAPAKLFTA